MSYLKVHLNQTKTRLIYTKNIPDACKVLSLPETRNERKSEMTKMTKKIKGSTQNWESGKLGRDAGYVVSATAEEELALANALELKPISIRMPTDLIRTLKVIAGVHGIGYQPLIRDVLSRFARAEMIDLLRQFEEQKSLESALSDEDSPAAKQLDKKCA